MDSMDERLGPRQILVRGLYGRMDLMDLMDGWTLWT